jgi:branched-chain amino acid transport system substrate-binding protein
MTAVRRLLLGVAIAAAGIGGAASAFAAENDIVVGFATAQSGFVLPYDQGAQRSAILAMETINAAGGINGRKFRWVISDTKSDRVQGAKAGADVVRQGADLVAVTCDYDYGGPAALAAQNAHKISFFECAEDAKAGIEGIGPNAFTTSIAAPVQGATMAEWSVKKKGWKNGYVLLDDSIEYDKSVCAGFDWMYPKVGGTIVAHDTFKNDDPSVAAQITRIRSASPPADVIMLCTYTPGGASALRQIRAAGINTPVVNGMSMDGSYWTAAVPGLSNFYVPVQGSIYGNDPDPKVNEFIVAYKERWKEAPPSSYALPGWVLIEVYAEAIKNAGGSTDTDKVTAELEKLKDFPTRFGPRSYSHSLHIQNIARYEIIGFTDGKPAPVEYWTISEPVPTNVLFRR